MSHSSTELLIDYWQSRMIDGKAPARATIDPTHFANLLPQVFMIGRRGPADYVFRLAGGMILNLHQMDLRGAAFTHLWTQNARLSLQTALEHARKRVSPIRLTAEGQSGPFVLPINMALMPLANPDGEIDRFLGIYDPTAPLADLAGQPIYRLHLVTLGGIAITPGVPAIDTGHLRLAAVGGSRL